MSHRSRSSHSAEWSVGPELPALDRRDLGDHRARCLHGVLSPQGPRSFPGTGSGRPLLNQHESGLQQDRPPGEPRGLGRHSNRRLFPFKGHTRSTGSTADDGSDGVKPAAPALKAFSLRTARTRPRARLGAPRIAGRPLEVPAEALEAKTTAEAGARPRSRRAGRRRRPRAYRGAAR